MEAAVTNGVLNIMSDDNSALVPLSANDLAIEDIEILTIELAMAAIALANKRVSKRDETRKLIVDATMKSLGKLAGEGLKKIAEDSSFHPEILGPLSMVSDVAVEELGKAFAGSMMALSDSKDSKLSELLDQPLKSGFETSHIALTVKATNEAERTLQAAQLQRAVFVLTDAASTRRNEGEQLSIRWMQAILCLRIGANAQAKEYIKLSALAMGTIRERATVIMKEHHMNAFGEQILLDRYRNNPDSVDFDWPTRKGDAIAPPESAEEYNSNGPHDRPAMRSPDSVEAFIQHLREMEM